MLDKLQLIDWSERYPEESALEIAIRQSTVCPCGKPKQIGEPTCGHVIGLRSHDETPQCCCNASWLDLNIDDCPIHGLNGKREKLVTKKQRLNVAQKTLAFAAEHWPIGELGQFTNFRCSCGAVLQGVTQYTRIISWKEHIRNLNIQQASESTTGQKGEK